MKSIAASLLVVALVVWQPNTGHGQSLNKLPVLGPLSRFDDACAMVATTKVGGLQDPKEQEYVSDCSRHPNTSVCQNTKSFVEKALEHPLPELVCAGNGPSRIDQSRPVNPGQAPQADRPTLKIEKFISKGGPASPFDDACAQLATVLTMGMHSVQEAEWIADCGKHPKREVCEGIRKFLADLPTQPVSELICETSADAPGRAIQSGPASAPTHRPAPKAAPRAAGKDDRPDPRLAASPYLAPERARWDDACSQWAMWKVLGLIDPAMPQLLADCQNHPDQDVCRNTKKFVEESTSKPVTDLVCRK